MQCMIAAPSVSKVATRIHSLLSQQHNSRETRGFVYYFGEWARFHSAIVVGLGNNNDSIDRFQVKPFNSRWNEQFKSRTWNEEIDVIVDSTTSNDHDFPKLKPFKRENHHDDDRLKTFHPISHFLSAYDRNIKKLRHLFCSPPLTSWA